jgi:hypothetical protein
VLVVSFLATNGFGQGRLFWQQGGVVLCRGTAGVGQCAVTDGSNGAIVAWADSRGSHESVWARRVNRDGSPMWQENGVRLRGETWSPMNLSACSDLAGGMIACWTEWYAGPYAAQVTAQRVDSGGLVRWGPTGVVVAGSDGDRDYYATAVGDGRGGAIVLWLRKQLQPDRLDSLCVQRLDSLGRPCWGPAGVLLSADTLVWAPPRICPDGLGGAYVAWSRGAWYTPWVQHVDSSGETSWPAPGVLACSTANEFMYVWDVARTTSGCAVSFNKGWIGDNGLWAQRIDTSAQLQWGPQGACVHPGAGGRIWNERAVGQLPGEPIWVWTERRDGIFDVYAQRLDQEGRQRWDSLGLWIGTVGSDQEQECEVMPDGRGGVIASWPRFRVNDWDLYAQRVDDNGLLCWGDSGLAVAGDTFKQYWVPALVNDGREGAIVCWSYAFAHGINAQRIGDASSVEDNVESGHAGHSLSRAATTIWKSTVVLPGKQEAELLDISGRKVMELQQGANDIRHLAPGVYFVREEGPRVPGSQRLSVRKVVIQR